MATEPDRTRYDGPTFFRYSSYDSPFWARNNRSAGRWNYPGLRATQYLSADPDTAWAELIRNEDLHDEDEVAQVRMPIWAVSLDQANLADYSTFEKAEKAGFSPAALVDDDWTECQREAEVLRGNGYSGVVAPSAALPGHLNITLFGRRVRASWGRPNRLRSAVPACVVAIGSPPIGLVSRVRHFGAEHAGYAEYIEFQAELSREELIERPEIPPAGVPVREGGTPPRPGELAAEQHPAEDAEEEDDA